MDHLGYFLGPQAESSDLLRRLLTLVVDDHVHWRRNYMPQDPSVLTTTDAAALAPQHELLEQETRRLLDELRRSFPFHSHRYLAHQQSDASLPSLVGALAGMLYNANNVTSESGNATLEMEMRAASDLMRMIGYVAPPDPPAKATVDEWSQYTQEIEDDYGWCHLTSGGTSANIEALWVARNVAYRPLAIAQACDTHGMPLPVEVADGRTVDIGELTPVELLNLPPRSAIHLLTDLYVGLDSTAKAELWLRETGLDVGYDPIAAMRDHAPVVLASGTAHYSVKKACDVLGLGSRALRLVPSDGRHRISVPALREALAEERAAGRNVVAVLAIVGTTEEGAVDPLHEVLALREECRAEGQDFWVHADAAWGGYFCSLLRPGAKDRVLLKAARAGVGSAPATLDRPELAKQIAASVDTQTDDHRAALARVMAAAASDDWDEAERAFDVLVDDLGWSSAPVLEKERSWRDAQIDPRLRVASTSWVDRFGQGDRIELELDGGGLDPSVADALDALGLADSITLDPHKMGYQPYACGAVAFRDARSRHHIAKHAPYVSEATPSRFTHQPLLHVALDRDAKVGADLRPQIKMLTASPYTLEGSRPSYPATALWMSVRAMPLDRDGIGSVVAASHVAARALYDLLRKWDEAERAILGPDRDPSFRLVPLAVDGDGDAAPPDTNLVIFGVAPTWSTRLADYAALTKAVYEEFRISAEKGDRAFSYSQQFFVSNTSFAWTEYPAECVADIARAAGIDDFEAAYPTTPMPVLRSAVANPYVLALRQRARFDVLLEFVRQLAAMARVHSDDLRKKDEATAAQPADERPEPGP